MEPVHDDPTTDRLDGLRGLADATLEALVVPSFTRIGYDVRRRLFDWSPLDELSMRDKVVAVTGATSGLGELTATTLARMGAEVLLLARNERKAEAARERIAAAAGPERARTYLVDMSDLGAVRAVVEEIRGAEPRLDVLVNNAGALLGTRETSVDGYELTFATMVLGPFALTEGLLPLLRERDDARVITVTSGGMYAQSLHLDDLQFEREPYRGSVAYARAKRAQVVLTRLWARRYRGTSVRFHAMHPGWAETPGFEASLPRFYRVIGPLARTPEQGVDTIVWLAASAQGAASSGRLWLDRRPRPFDKLPGTRVSAREAAELWEACERLTSATG
ncbi:MAG: SDR family NAD(P)-dependent oxidoreductase [Planctomycetaceae bacterium]